MGNWVGSVYALDVWRSLVPLSPVLTGVKARRIAVKDTLLLVTREEAPFFTAYRIRYDAGQGLFQLDSLWSPTDPTLRNTPDALHVWGDTAYLAITYNPTSFAHDSLVIAVNLRTRQVVGSWQVYPNPAEIVRIGNALYVACYGDFSGNLRISRVVPSSSTVTTWDAGYPSYGGFATDTSGAKDTVLFWDGDTLRAFDVVAGQTAPGAYLGIASSGAPFTPYAVLWAGDHLHLSFTNFSDTSLIVIRDPDLWPYPPYLDTVFVSMGVGGIGYPSLRRFLCVEADTSRTTTALQTDRAEWHIGPLPARDWIFWDLPTPAVELSLWDAQGRQIKTLSPQEKRGYVGDLPAGVYLFHARLADGRFLTKRLLKE
uniref:Secretion system C-terminal sorting domain-containing protein n=1 Tax=uncultured Bacteroidota bacterium TaxID=152509 RepID=H5SMB5_9BACT|nr:hypothetical protein HGMM_F50B04C27 [uncultured Bacteroidetes bacterium]